MRYEAEHRFLEHVFGLTPRLLPARTISCAKSDLGESHGETALRLGFEECGITCDISPPFQILRSQARLAQNRRQRAGR